jgi:hypothetical protein
MTAPNPYAAPHAAGPPGPGALQSAYGHTYVPLGWRTTVAALSVFGLTLASLALHVSQVAFGDRLKNLKDLVPLMLVGLAGLGVLAMLVASAVFVCIWIHRASRNLKGLGRVGMRNTPGGCVASFFIPIANLWLPLQAMKEIWQASDPTAEQGSWFAAKSTPLVGLWWGAWIVTGVISVFVLFVQGDPSAEGSIGLVTDATRAFAAAMLVILMRGIEARQEQAAAALQGRPAAG